LLETLVVRRKGWSGWSRGTAEPDQLRVLGSWLNELSGGKVDGEEQSNLFLQPEIAKASDSDVRKIVSELIALLNGKDFLNDSEAMGLLRKLNK